MCVEISDVPTAMQLQEQLSECDCVRFSDGCWYKFTKKSATKERAILEACAACGISPEAAMAFGDDYADIGILKLCGKGVAMGNAIDEVKREADLVIGSNDEDGIARYLTEVLGNEENGQGSYGSKGNRSVYCRGEGSADSLL